MTGEGIGFQTDEEKRRRKPAQEKEPASTFLTFISVSSGFFLLRNALGKFRQEKVLDQSNSQVSIAVHHNKSVGTEQVVELTCRYHHLISRVIPARA